MQNWASKASTVPNLHAGATTSVAQIGSINVVLSLWIEKRQTVKAKAGKSFVTSVVSARATIVSRAWVHSISKLFELLNPRS